jgi:hypothetical protein
MLALEERKPSREKGSVPYRPPLGLPGGSVRALLTLLIVAVVVAEVARGRAVESLWVETLMIALAHYFTSRRFVRLSPEVVRRLEAEGYLEGEANPLWLPRHSIRAVVVLAFVGLAVYLHQAGRLWESQALSLLGVVFAYLLGVLARSVWVWWSGGRPSRRWGDLQAAVVLGVVGITAVAYLAGRPDLIPPQARNVPLGLALFYFGSR